MKNLIITIVVAFVLIDFNFSYAQFSLGIDAGAQMPISSQFKALVNNGYGISLSSNYKIPFIPLAISLSTSYDNWAYKSITYYSESNSGIHAETFGNINMYSFNIEAGPMLYINFSGSDISSYLGIDVGFMAATSTAQGASYGSGLVYSPFAGVRYNLPPGIVSFDLNVKDSNFQQNNSSDTLSWFDISAGVFLSL